MDVKTLAGHLADYLQVDAFADYCPNGLQLENSGKVGRVATAVTASLETIEKTRDAGANVLIVHHGYFWKNESPLLVGMKYQRIKALMDYDIALLAYHLPLDVHPECGNNGELAKVLGLKVTGTIKPDGKVPLLMTGELSEPSALSQFVQHCTHKLGQAPLVIEAGSHPIKRLAWCTGAGQDFIEAAKSSGADAYLSGEVSERTYHQAKELGIHYFACGHTATERFGIQALGRWVHQQFRLPVEFIDSKNCV